MNGELKEAVQARVNILPEFIPHELKQLISRPTLNDSYFGELKYESTDYRVYVTEEEHPVLIQKRDEFGQWQDFLTVDMGGRFHYEW